MVRDSHFSAAIKEYDTGCLRPYSGASQFEFVAVRPHQLFRDEGLLAPTPARVNSNLWLPGHTSYSGMKASSPLLRRGSLTFAGGIDRRYACMGFQKMDFFFVRD